MAISSAIARAILERTDQLSSDLISLRRDFHKFPELGWMEFRTSALLISKLSQLGYELSFGRMICEESARLGVPSSTDLTKAYHQAQKELASEEIIAKMIDGFTGVVASMSGELPGPTIAFRFDIDALEVAEAEDKGHFPAAAGFNSQHPGVMHACGHDGHAAIGVGIATIIGQLRKSWPGKVVFIFQPAEEGTRGAHAMAEAGVVDDCDILISCHLGTEATRTGHVIGGVSRFFATKKIDACFKGSQSHAALNPETGHNALLSAATAVLNIHAISRHSHGSSRINVGIMNAGSGRNVVPGNASLKLEVRAASDDVLDFLERRTRAILEAAAAMQNLECSIKVVGSSPSASSDDAIIKRMQGIATLIPEIDKFDEKIVFRASDDAAALMKRVQQNGGMACYAVIGSHLSSGHHTPHFDFDEAALPIAVKLLSLLGLELAQDRPKQ
jgi:aminobenzoyl-glutamate utilization protein A